MNLTNILPLNKSRLDVLFEIYAEDENYLRNISKELKMNPSLCFRILQKLYESNLLIKKERGKEVLYSLKKGRDYKILVSFLEDYHLEKKTRKSDILKVIINLIVNNKEIMNSSYKIIIFGS